MFNIFWSVFLGILAGTGVQLLVNFCVTKLNERAICKSLKFELEFNMSKIDSYIEELTEFRNAVNGDTLSAYFGFFTLEKCLFISTYSMLNSGLLYKKLTQEKVGQLLKITDDFTPGSSGFLNQNIVHFRENIDKDGIKQEAVKFINYWEKKFKENKSIFQKVIESL